MKMKNLLLTIAATFGMTALAMAQNVPNYVPTNGLVGWWPFNGNANDESGNGNNGTVNGATLTIDRFGLSNAAYSFNTSSISINNASIAAFGLSSFSVTAWFKTNMIDAGTIIRYDDCFQGATWGVRIGRDNQDFSAPGIVQGIETPTSRVANMVSTSQTYNDNSWQNVVYVRDVSAMNNRLYLNGNLIAQTSFSNINDINITGNPLLFGTCGSWAEFFVGVIDDIGIWNRALTQQEITDLYNAVNCANNTAITPQTNSLTIGSTATFTASTSDPNPSHIWQSDLGQGFQTLNNFGNYSGVNLATLNIANVQLSEHNQPIRVISTSGNCIDTSNVAIISITDTCINTITDTTFITVTDTLVINTTITSLNPPNNANTIMVFPNPTNDHITINYGNFSLMNGYQLKIENSLGQQVFQTNITQQSDYLNLTTWGGNGLYFVHIIDPQGNTIDIRKIVLQ